MRWVWAAVLAVVPCGVQAQETVAAYWERSGTVAPQFAWSVSVTFHNDGSVAVRHCKGYETDGPACTLGTGTVSVEVLNTIRDAANAAGLPENPPKRAPDNEIPVGGGASGGAVWWQGNQIELPAWPAAADAARVTSVLNAIRTAIPDKLTMQVQQD